ncbi:MAG: NTP/NDP exchange transporter [Gemmatimonadales bacterium]
MSRTLLARLVDVRDDEIRPMLVAGTYFFFLLASYFVLRPIRDAMGVAAGVSQLPYLFVGTLAAMLVCQPLFAALVRRFPARRFIPATYQFFAAALLIFWLTLRGAGPDLGTAATGAAVWLGRIFFVWTSVFNLFVVSVFWSLMADTFSAEQAKRLFGFIGVGGTLGAIVGAAATATLARSLGTETLLLVSFALLEIATLCVLWFPRSVRRADDRAEARNEDAGLGGGLWTGVTHVVRSRFLLGIAGFLILYTIGSTILYFQQADILRRAFATAADRTRILAAMEAASQIITVLVQLFFTGRIIRLIGLPAALALMPAISIVGFVAMGASGTGLLPTFLVFVVFNVTRRGANFALTNPSMEALYTVVSREDKYKAKSFIETFVYRAGDQIAAWGYSALARLGLTPTQTAWPGAVLAAVFLGLGVWLGRRHRVAAETGSVES